MMQTKIILPQDLLDLIFLHALQRYKDDAELCRTQVNLRRLADAPAQAGSCSSSAHPSCGTALLTLAQLTRVLRVRALPPLWNTLRITSGRDVAVYDSWFAARNREGDDSYASWVEHVKVQWSASTQYHTEWEQALARIVKNLTNVRTFQWDASFARLPDVVADAIEHSCARLTSFTHYSSRSVDDDDDDSQCFLSYSRLPGLITRASDDGYIPSTVRYPHEYYHPIAMRGIDELCICDKQAFSSADASPYGWSWWDSFDGHQFSLVLLPTDDDEEQDYFMPPEVWLVDVCRQNALLGLKRVRMSSDRLLWYEELWPLWVWLDVRFDERQSCRRSYKYGVGGRVDTPLYPTSMFAALNTLHSALCACTANVAKEGDWLRGELLGLLAETEITLATMVCQNDLASFIHHHRQVEALQATKDVVNKLLANDDTRRRVAEPWTTYSRAR